ncbi:transposase [Paraburkholderia mimosarum]|uniref:transposase n=1 Tax=Paraburkholderia mimosarum TaxID=312026 RepID=UPI00192E6967|nr:transposase [Paraburkholderia mimosarum]
MFELTQALALYDFYQTQVTQCDERIELALRNLHTGIEPPTGPLPAARHRTTQPNGFAFDVRAALYGMLGVDLTQIHGLGPYVALKLVAECGNDMSRWPTVKHFTSWLCLAPGNKISGGKILSSKTRRSSSKAAVALRLAATTVGRTDTVAFTGACRLASARPRPSQLPLAKLPCCSTTRCATEWTTSIPAPPTVRSATDSVFSATSHAGRTQWAMSCNRKRVDAREFLRKAGYGQNPRIGLQLTCSRRSSRRACAGSRPQAAGQALRFPGA